MSNSLRNAKKSLTAREQRFFRAVIGGKSETKAYLEISPDAFQEAATSDGSRMTSLRQRVLASYGFSRNSTTD
jgi:hypothetical protein